MAMLVITRWSSLFGWFQVRGMCRLRLWTFGLRSRSWADFLWIVLGTPFFLPLRSIYLYTYHTYIYISYIYVCVCLYIYSCLKSIGHHLVIWSNRHVGTLRAIAISQWDIRGSWSLIPCCVGFVYIMNLSWSISINIPYQMMIKTYRLLWYYGIWMLNVGEWMGMMGMINLLVRFT